MSESAAVIIGGTDGPTAVYLPGSAGIFGPVMTVTQCIVLLAVLALAAYFLGNLSPSILMAKARGIDIKKEGSGNAGTTNALRVLGKKAGAITFLVDVLKGVAASLLGGLIGGDLAGYICALAVFVGHIWPVIYRFNGGKGVATIFGAAVGISPALGFSALGIVVIVVFITKRMSIGSITGAVSFPFLSMIFEPGFIIPSIVIALIVILKHRANIVRIIHGEEPVMSIFEKRDRKQENHGNGKES